MLCVEFQTPSMTTHLALSSGPHTNDEKVFLSRYIIKRWYKGWWSCSTQSNSSSGASGIRDRLEEISIWSLFIFFEIVRHCTYNRMKNKCIQYNHCSTFVGSVFVITDNWTLSFKIHSKSNNSNDNKWLRQEILSVMTGLEGIGAESHEHFCLNSVSNASVLRKIEALWLMSCMFPGEVLRIFFSRWLV